MSLPPAQPFFIQAKRNEDGTAFRLEAGWDTIKPPVLDALYDPESRIGRALEMIERSLFAASLPPPETLDPPPPRRSRAASPRA
jgi:hypothetical protein